MNVSRLICESMAPIWATVLLVPGSLLAAESQLGERAAYRIELQLVVDTLTRPQPELAGQLAEVIGQRVDATLSPFWDLKILLPQGKNRHRLLSLLGSTEQLPVSNGNAFPWGELVGELSAQEKLPDKRMFLSVTALATGYQLRCCEWDGYVLRWGSFQQRVVFQRSLLAESCFQILREVFAPLAVVHTVAMDDGQVTKDKPAHAPRDPRTKKQVVLQFKGSQLLSESVGKMFYHPGDVYQPLLRRSDRSGDLLGVSEVPWTYLALNHLTGTSDVIRPVEVTSEQNFRAAKGDPTSVIDAPVLSEDQALNEGLPTRELKSKVEKQGVENSASMPWRADIHSGLRRPFGIRLRGRSQLLALAVRTVRTQSYVRFYPRHNPTQALVGYQVFRQQSLENSSSQLLGLTNSRGIISVDNKSVSVDNKGTRIITLLLRSDGRLLAKIPLVPGVAKLVEVPIIDDMARLQAQARLVEVREQLVDLVARRNILLARARRQFSAGHLDQTQELLHQLDALPSRSQFNQILSAAENRPSSQSKDPQVQARIEKLFANARSLLGRSLNPRLVSDLQNEVNTASRSQSADSP